MSVWLMASVAIGCSSGSHGGSSSTSGGGGACGSVTVLGQCTGTVLEYCDPVTSALVEEDCSTVAPPDAGEVFVCELIDAAYGYDCAAPVGGSCVGFDSMGNQFATFCAGSGTGCVYSTTNATCESNVPACLAYDADGGFVLGGAAANATACAGNLLELFCDEDQPVAQDCAALGGTCGAGTGADAAACIGLPAGEPCDDALFVCATGITCGSTDGGQYTYCE